MITASAFPTADSFLADGGFWSKVLIGGFILIAFTSWRSRASAGRFAVMLIPRFFVWGIVWFFLMMIGLGFDAAAGKYEQMQHDRPASANTESHERPYDPSRDNKIPSLTDDDSAYIPDPRYMPERPADW